MRQKTKYRARDYERLRNSPSPSMETPQDSDPSEDRTFSWAGLSGPQYPHPHPDPARGQRTSRGPVLRATSPWDSSPTGNPWSIAMRAPGGSVPLWVLHPQVWPWMTQHTHEVLCGSVHAIGVTGAQLHQVLAGPPAAPGRGWLWPSSLSMDK